MSTSERQTAWKALLFDYDFIRSRSDDDCCYALSLADVAALMNIVSYMKWKTRWQSDEGAELDMDWIDEFSSELERKLMSGCCDDHPGRIYRFTNSGIYQASDDNGATWFNDAEADPRNQVAILPGFTNVDDAINRCRSAENAEYIFNQWALEMVSILEAGTILSGIIAGLVGFLGSVLTLSVVGSAIGVLLLGLAAALLQGGSVAFEAAVNSTTQETFKCLWFCHADEDGRFSEQTWQNLLAAIATEFDGLAELWYYQQVAALGYQGVSNIGMSGTSSGATCDECDCADTFCYVFDFKTAGAEDWTAVSRGAGAFGDYQSGTGWVGTDAIDTISNPDIASRRLWIERTFAARTLTRIDVTYTLTKGNIDQTNASCFALLAGASALINRQFLQMANGTDLHQIWTGTQAGVTALQVTLGSSRDTSAPYAYGGLAVVSSIRVEGLGSNPFGDDNCP